MAMNISLAAVPGSLPQAQRRWQRLSSKDAGWPQRQKIIDEQAKDVVRN